MIITLSILSGLLIVIIVYMTIITSLINIEISIVITTFFVKASFMVVIISSLSTLLTTRIAVRTLSLNVYKVEDEAMLKFVTDKTAAPYFSNLV